ncbi:MAG: TolC family protein [Planctomycetes bacterium]|nr:TolC family protein [Planctomycetota bacterium]
MPIAAFVLVLLLLIPACTSPADAREYSDVKTLATLARKELELRGSSQPVELNTPADRLFASLVDSSTGLALPGATVTLELKSLLALAARNSRELQNAKEALQLAALDYLSQAHRFQGIPFVLADANGTAAETGDSLDLGGDFGITRLFENGAEAAASFALSGLRLAGGSLDLSSTLNLTIALPLLRNSELNLARENLTQADRDVLYAWRTFERFKQDLAVDVLSSYLLMLSSKQRLANEDANVQSLMKARDRNIALFDEGRISIVEVDQARQQVLSAENRMVLAQQSVERSLDGLKSLLGVPVDVALVGRAEDLQGLDALLQDTWVPQERAALLAAMRQRFDLRNSVDAVTDSARRVLLSEDQLRPGLDLNLGWTLPSEAGRPLRYDSAAGIWTGGLNLDLGIDRHSESLALRGADVTLARTLRQQEASAEAVKSEVRDSLRGLSATRSSWGIAVQAVSLAERRAASTLELLEEGRAITRDYLESQEALIRSQNDLVNAAVEYHIAWLRLFRDTGALVMAPGGLDYELSRTLLGAE